MKNHYIFNFFIASHVCKLYCKSCKQNWNIKTQASFICWAEPFSIVCVIQFHFCWNIFHPLRVCFSDMIVFKFSFNLISISKNCIFMIYSTIRWTCFMFKKRSLCQLKVRHHLNGAFIDNSIKNKQPFICPFDYWIVSNLFRRLFSLYNPIIGYQLDHS